MAREPHYPEDAPVGDDKKAGRAARRQRPEASSAAPADTVGKSGDGKRTKQIVAGAAIGIGSAAIVAALLWNRNRGRNDKA